MNDKNRKRPFFRFRKLISSALFLSMLLAAFSSVPVAAEAVPVPSENVLYGDVNNDGGIAAADALLVLQHTVRLAKITDEDAFSRADVDADGKVRAADALLILRYSTGIDIYLPATVKAMTTLKKELRFDENGDFRVLQISDVQIEKGGAGNTKTIEGIEALVKATEPDFVMFSGDLTSGYTTEAELHDAVTAIVYSAESRSIPWAHIYGYNDETSGSLTKEQQQAVYESFKFCVSKAGDESVTGVGNYVLPVKASDSDSLAFNIWGVDTGSSLDARTAGLADDAKLPNNFYPTFQEDFIDFSQQRWYYRTSKALEEYNGARIPGIMFGNIPLPEYCTVANNALDCYFKGTCGEQICPSLINSGMFSTIYERGDVGGYYCGHDHKNNFTGKYCGIEFGYAASAGYNEYRSENIMGGRIFDIKESDPDSYETTFIPLKSLGSQFAVTDGTDVSEKYLPYKTDKNTVILNDGESINGVYGAFNTDVAVSTEIKSAGWSGITMTPKTPTADANKVGAMAFVDFSQAVNLNDYEYISFDLYLSKDYVAPSGSFQLNLTSSADSQDGFNWAPTIVGLKAGWNTFTIRKSEIANTVGANWANIVRLRLTWFNDSGINDSMLYFGIDNIKAFNYPEQYKTEKAFVVNSCDNLSGWSGAYGGEISLNADLTTDDKTGLYLSPTAPIMGASPFVGAMAHYKSGTFFDLTDYEYVGYDLYISEAYTGANGYFQLNYATSGDDGYNWNTRLIDLTPGWNHLSIKKSDIGKAVNNVDWAKISCLRITWFNDDSCNPNIKFCVDNIRAYND